MLEWFKNLSEGWQTAIFGAGLTVALAAIGGLFALFKWLSGKNDGPVTQEKTIYQEGSDPTATTIDGDTNIIAGRDVHTGIDSDAALNTLVKTSRQLGRTKEENTRLKKTIRQLEAQLARPSLEANIALEQSTPAPSAQAKDLANLITEDDGLYARALKAIAQGDNEKADSLLDQTQQFLDTVQQRKDDAQARIYMARMQNASYAGRPRDALQYCDKLTTLAGNDSLIINEMAVIYYENAKYKEAEPPMQRALKIDEASFGKDHPKVATDLNNLAQLYEATNRLKEAEPLMKRALEIDEASLGKDHPDVAISLNNLAALYKATNRLKEAEPLMQRALKIDEASFGKDHPKVAIHLNNLAQLYKATNRLKETEPLMERHLVIFLQFTRRTGHPHPHLQAAIENYRRLFMQMGHSEAEVAARLKRLAPEMFESPDKQVKEQSPRVIGAKYPPPRPPIDPAVSGFP